MRRRDLGFAAVVERLIGRALGDEGLAVAVSGGPDSLALLLLARAAFGDRVRALTVDHGLRPASAAEAAHVAQICASLGVQHATLRWQDEKPQANLQAAAREARYALMGNWCVAEGVGVLATAHHADDQAETLLLRLARGSGISGLAGVRAVRPLHGGVLLIRPLLDRRRAELAALVGQAGITAIDDPSNRDERFDRTHARALLAATDWLAVERLAASAAHLADADAALAWAADLAWASRVATDGHAIVIDAAGLPHELARRLTRRALVTIASDCRPRGEEIERLMVTLATGGIATLGGVRATGGVSWRFEREAQRRPRG